MRLLHLFKRFATAHLNHVFRNATAKDIDLFTQRTIREGWHIGPYDYQCGFAFDPKGFFVREIGQEIVSHFCSIRYPNHHSHLGGQVVSKSFRGKGYGMVRDLDIAIKVCDEMYTIGIDVHPHSSLRRGFDMLWDTHVAMFSLQTLTDKLAQTSLKDLIVKPLHEVSIEELLKYDRYVFGTDRRAFMERWISVPGSFGYAAVDGNDKIIGYAVLKPVIRGGGTEIGLAIAPLYSDDPHIAKCLLKTAAERCLANEAVPKTKLEMFHPVGDICGEGAPLLMKELEAELTHIAKRMYTKGIPPGRQTKNIYGIASPTFD